MRNFRERVEEKDKEKKALEERTKSLQKQLANSKVSRIHDSSCAIHWLYRYQSFTGIVHTLLSVHAFIFSLLLSLPGEGAGASGQHAAAATGIRTAAEGEEGEDPERAAPETWSGGIR